MHRFLRKSIGHKAFNHELQVIPKIAFVFCDVSLKLDFQDLRPDSVIFSLFSSASASVERCSFASDVPHQHSVSSLLYQHLSGHELSEALSGPGPYPDKSITVHRNSISLSRKDKPKVQKLDSKIPSRKLLKSVKTEGLDPKFC
ncbi:hypothetical protein AAHA92_12570 [Salvia divinorum]|uniref:Uncharacterized protein n=1 Tax=Salvia divinorum TaxID=28513 RepID=A0ABD1HKP1_SALDI